MPFFKFDTFDLNCPLKVALTYNAVFVNISNRRFVALPDFLYIDKSLLKYLDVLTYTTIRSFLNSAMDYSYPSSAKISERSGLCTTFINESIQRLEQAGILTIDHSICEGVCNRYYFNEIYRFERIPYELFEADDLTVYEKATLLCLRQFFNHGLLETIYNLKELAEYLGITKDALSKQYSSLRRKGYIFERSITSKGWSTDLIIRGFTYKINWIYDYGI